MSADASVRFDHLMRINRPRWMDRGDLHHPQPDTDPDWWWAPEWLGGDRLPTQPRHAEKAIQLCNTCPMRAACELHGLKHEPAGVWGGRNIRPLLPSQRAAMVEQLERRRRWTA